MFREYSVAMVTPFEENGEVDWKGIESITRHLLKNDVRALLISGTTGEQHSMTIEERTLLYSAVKEIVGDSAEVYAGVAAVTTKDAIKLAEAARRADVDGVMVGLPPYVRPSQAELIEYVRAVRDAAAVPILLYNNPPRTGSDISAESIARLYEEGVIAALKEAGGTLKADEVITVTAGKLPLFTGSDRDVVDHMARGFHGLTSILGNLTPVEMGQIVLLMKQGEPLKAQSVLNSLLPLANAVFATSTPVGLKYALSRLGVTGGVCRAPLGQLAMEHQEAINRYVDPLRNKLGN